MRESCETEMKYGGSICIALSGRAHVLWSTETGGKNAKGKVKKSLNKPHVIKEIKRRNKLNTDINRKQQSMNEANRKNMVGRNC